MRIMHEIWQKHGRAILFTFEVFWIVVFLLERVITGGGSDIPQFVYVNF